jgi:hypothetical protein
MMCHLLYRCRRCDIVFVEEPEPGETEANVLFRQVLIHECEGITAEHHKRRGIADLVGFNDEPEEVKQS